MSVAFPRWWSAVVLVALPAVVLAQDAKNDSRPALTRVREMKPVAVDAADSPLLKLQKERFNARLAAAQEQLRALDARSVSMRDSAPLLVRLTADGADVEGKPADRVKWLQLRVDVLKEQERQAKTQAKAGASAAADANLATAARADAEIELLKLKESLKGEK